MDPVFDAFGEKVAAGIRPHHLDKSMFKVMHTRAPSASMPRMPSMHVTKTSTSIYDGTVYDAEDTLPNTFKGLVPRKTARERKKESMDRKEWKQTLKDVPLSILASGAGYGLGRTLAEIIGEKTVGHIATEGGGVLRATMKPGWVKAMPLALAVMSGAGAFAGARVREGLKARRESAK